jgi:hypothetical protein
MCFIRCVAVLGTAAMARLAQAPSEELKKAIKSRTRLPGHKRLCRLYVGCVPRRAGLREHQQLLIHSVQGWVTHVEDVQHFLLECLLPHTNMPSAQN